MILISFLNLPRYWTFRSDSVDVSFHFPSAVSMQVRLNINWVNVVLDCTMYINWFNEENVSTSTISMLIAQNLNISMNCKIYKKYYINSAQTQVVWSLTQRLTKSAWICTPHWLTSWGGESHFHCVRKIKSAMTNEEQIKLSLMLLKRKNCLKNHGPLQKFTPSQLSQIIRITESFECLGEINFIF